MFDGISPYRRSVPARLVKSLAAALSLSLLLAASAMGGAPAATGAQLATADSPALLRVRATTPRELRVLADSGVDVLETRDGADLFVMGSARVQARLAGLGLDARVAKDLAVQPSARPFGADTFFGGYHTIAEHQAHLQDVAAAHPDLAQLITYGASWRKQQALPDGHDLLALCITKRRPGDCALNPDTDKPRFFLMSAIHARELTTSELTWRWIDYLIAGYGVDPEITALLDGSELWVAPLTNPDGRAKVEEGGDAPLLQRKNLHTTQGAGCAVPLVHYDQDGVDLNRNANFAWGGASNSLCSAVYQGASPASEPEEQALEALLGQLFHDQRGEGLSDAAPVTATGAMLTLHSYGNLVLFPWGYTECLGVACAPVNRAPNDAALRAFSFRLSHYNQYSTGQASELLYAASGTTDDYAYGKLGIYGATFEIGPSDFSHCGEGASPTGTAFTPPYDCQDGKFWPENRGALLYAAKLARQPYALALGPNTTTVTQVLSGTLNAVIDDNALGSNQANVGRPAPQIVTAAEVYLDLPPWAPGALARPLTAQDGVFDSPTETAVVHFSPCNTPAGRHLAYVRGRNASGAWGPPTAQWVDVVAPPNMVCYFFPKQSR